MMNRAPRRNRSEIGQEQCGLGEDTRTKNVIFTFRMISQRAKGCMPNVSWIIQKYIQNIGIVLKMLSKAVERTGSRKDNIIKIHKSVEKSSGNACCHLILNGNDSDR